MSEPELETGDRAYRRAFSRRSARRSFDPHLNIAMIRTGEVTLACLMQIAVMAATAEGTSSPTKTRKFCELVAKRLQSMISSAKKNFAEDGVPFAVVEADLGLVTGPLN